MAAELALRVEEVSKEFAIMLEPPLTAQKALYNFVCGKNNFRRIWALRAVSFSVAKAEALGIIGANASGKTTLLRIIAGIYQPTNGRVSYSGRIAASLELGAGFGLEFTGRENLYLYGAIFGLTRRQTTLKIPHIQEFSELGDFLNAPLRQYSVGMRMRLAFSLAVNFAPDILLVDEMLAVGDAAFRNKCLNKLEQLKKQGTTLLLVSHHPQEIAQVCDRAIMLHEGSIYRQGNVSEVLSAYESAYAYRH